MGLALYSAAVSLFYAALWVLLPGVAEALILAFVALLVVPASRHRLHSPLRMRRP